MNQKHHRRALFGAVAVAFGALPPVSAFAQDPEAPPSLESLTGIRPPDPVGTEAGKPVVLADYIVDRDAAIRLGKAAFWDLQLGSDGKTACASCHFYAGGNRRFRNTLAPGPTTAFDKPANSAKWGPNHQVNSGDFPTHVLADPNDRESAILSSTDDVIGAQGVFNRLLKPNKPGMSRFDKCDKVMDTTFQVGGVNVRRVTGRKAPTAINAALNVRNFWDGRANDVFNGFSPFGNRDPDAGIFVTADPSGASNPSPTKVRLALRNASAASQAVGPPLSGVEMSCGGRVFADIGKRVLDKRPLTSQEVAVDDSVLVGWREPSARPTYRQLIQQAFHPRLWNSSQSVSFEPNKSTAPTYSQAAANFSLFFGLAIQMYEATLISDQTPLDAHLDGTGTLGAAELRGMDVFLNKGKCVNCHGGPELTNAATLQRRNQNSMVERMIMGDNEVAVYDEGFYNIGVRPTAEDIGAGGTDPWGNPLSLTRQYRQMLLGQNVPDSFQVDPCSFAVPLTSPCDPSVTPSPDFRDAVDGAFKTPGLRNIALHGPYFHNGSRMSLEQVVEFYNRGGDRRSVNPGDTTGFGGNNSNLDADIQSLGLTDEEKSDLVAFLENALTDPRVKWEKAPFDHPSLRVRDGHVGDESWVKAKPQADLTKPQQAIDLVRKFPASGKNGRPQWRGPLKPFDEDIEAPPAVTTDPTTQPAL